MRFDADAMHVFSCFTIADREGCRLTGHETSKPLMCKKCRQSFVGVGDNVLRCGSKVVLVRVGNDWNQYGDKGVVLISSAIMTKDFVAVCPNCGNEQKVYVR